MAPQVLYLLFAVLASVFLVVNAGVVPALPRGMLTKRSSTYGEWKRKQAARPRGADIITPVEYYNGAVMNACRVRFYPIFYGTASDWTASKQKHINAFLGSFSTSSLPKWYDIHFGYTSKDPVSGAVKNITGYPTLQLPASTTPNYNIRFNSSINYGDFPAVVEDAVKSGYFGSTTTAKLLDPCGIYLILTAENVKAEYFCTNFCGYHDSSTIGDVRIKWAFTGNSEVQCPGSCGIRSQYPQLNTIGSLGTDAMITMIAHEVSETITDPFWDAWHTAGDEAENADVCQWRYEPTLGNSPNSVNKATPYNYVAPYNTAKYYYQIQQIYNVRTKKCAGKV